MQDDPPFHYAKKPPRAGELLLEGDPAALAEAGLAFIGRIRTPWGPQDCPRNLRVARARGMAPAVLEIAAPYRPGLAGLRPGDAAVMIYWMAWAERRAIVVAPPGDGPRSAGVFATRSPARPNPLALGTVRILSLDAAAGRVEVDAADCWDGTPLVDLKPFIASVDLPPG